MAETTIDLSKLSDEELTPKQLKQRIKNREKKARLRANKQNTENNASSSSKKSKPLKKEEVKLTDAEYTQQVIDDKTHRIERNPKAAVVSIAETTEARTLAFKVNEINMITDFTRSNMGTKRVSFQEGQQLLELFEVDVSQNIDKFIELASSFGIGSKRTLSEYKKVKAKEKKKLERIEAFKTESIANETPEETKEREAQVKAVEKTEADLEKAKEALRVAEEKLHNAKELENDGFTKRAEAQKVRKLEAEAKAEAQSEVETKVDTEDKQEDKK